MSIGARFASQDIVTIVKASALNPQAATKIKPKIVDDQAGSSDITQSMAAKVMEMIKKTRPGPLSICSRRRYRLRAVRSCWSESQLSTSASPDQNAK